MAKTPRILNAHAKKRAEERYDVNLNKHARREVVRMIKGEAPGAEYIGRQSNNRTFWRVEHGGEKLNVVYDKQRNTLCTVLPKEAREFQAGTDWSQATRTHENAAKREAVTAELAEIWKDE